MHLNLSEVVISVYIFYLYLHVIEPMLVFVGNLSVEIKLLLKFILILN
jgi:hypothetical protein